MTDTTTLTAVDIDRAATLCAMVGRHTGAEREFLRDFTKRAILELRDLRARRVKAERKEKSRVRGFDMPWH